MTSLVGNNVVELGFVEKTPSWKLRSKFFPSKIGGKPAWLSLTDLPSKEDLQCQNCKKPLVFLLQVYAPIDDSEETFHRSLFLFLCAEAKCSKLLSSTCFTVFRSQLPRKNSFFDFNPPDEKDQRSDSPSAAQFQALCDVCGCPSSIKCESCQIRNYCSEDHKQLEWEKGHKTTCSNESNGKIKKCKKTFPCLLPEYELVTDSEELPEKPKEKSDAEKMKEYKEFLSTAKMDSSLKHELTDDKLEGLIKKPDKIFNKFKKRIALEPEQVLRYQRGGVPLWVSENIPSNKDIPACSCGAERIFEFQVLPQLLNHLSFDSVQDSVDWGTLIIYTCSKSCNIGSKYVKEFVWKQDFSNDEK